MAKTQTLRILTILTRYGTEQYPQAAGQIDAWFSRYLPNVARKMIIVDNALPSSTIQTTREQTLIGGNNHAREFSAFDVGLKFVGAEVWDYDLIHLATSAFHTLYVAYLERFSESLLRAASTRPVCLGHVDCYNEPVEILGCRTQHWIRTCFFFLPPTEAKALGSFVSLDDSRSMFAGDPGAPFRPDAPLSSNYQQYIIGWLTGADIGQGVVWHSSVNLNRESLPAFEHKALSIMNEQLLGVRLRAQGCNLVDVTWLSTSISENRAGTPWWTTPWREQLANRDRDRIAAVGALLENR